MGYPTSDTRFIKYRMTADDLRYNSTFVVTNKVNESHFMNQQPNPVEASTRASWTIVAAWVLMLVLCMLVACYAVAFLLVPAFGPQEFKAKFAGYPITTWAHLTGGAVAICLGPWQFVGGLRNRLPKVHRWLGWIYAMGVSVGALAGISMSFVSDGGYVTHFGFGALGVLWLVSLIMAVRAIRLGDIEQHRAWMIRNFALTLAAVALRVYLPISAGLGIPFDLAYQAISWLCWVPNLMVAEAWLRTRSAVGSVYERPVVSTVDPS